MHRITRILPALALAALWAMPCLACDVPVFRYALERWTPAVYELNVIAPQGNPANDTPPVNSLQSLLDSANCALHYSGSGASVSGGVIPRMELAYRDWQGEKILIWSGRASAENVEKLVDSPARREIAGKLLGGATAVWVFLEGEDRAKNEAALGRLETALDQIERSLTLPESVTRLQESMTGKLRVDFPVVKIQGSSEAEKILVDMLIRSEPDLESYRTEPMAFPVFGRGRVLYALAGDGIDSVNTAGACVFLAGPCACEIKESNPGMDLLMRAGWASGIGESWVDASENVSLSSLAALAGGRPDDNSGGKLFHGVVITLLTVLILVGAGSVVLLRKIRRRDR